MNCNFTNEYNKMIVGTALGILLVSIAYIMINVFHEVHILLSLLGLVGTYYVYKMGIEDEDRHKILNLCCDSAIFAWMAGTLHTVCFIAFGILSKDLILRYTYQGDSILNVPLFFGVGCVCLYIIHHGGLHGCKIASILPLAVPSSLSFILCGAYILV